MAGVALQAAEQLAAEGNDVEVVDLRTLTPLDTGTILTSFAKPADWSNRTGGFAQFIAAIKDII